MMLAKLSSEFLGSKLLSYLNEQPTLQPSIHTTTYINNRTLKIATCKYWNENNCQCQNFWCSKLHYIPYIDIHWLSFVSVSLCGVSGFLRRSLIVVVLFKRRPQGLRSVEDVGTSGEMSWRSRYFQQLRIKPKILETSRSLALITAYKPLTLDLCKLKLSQGLCLFLGKTHIHNLLYLAPLWHVSTYHET